MLQNSPTPNSSPLEDLSASGITRRSFLQTASLATAAFLADPHRCLAGPEVVPEGPSEAKIIPHDRRLFVSERQLDGTLAPSSAYVVKGILWNPSPSVWPQEPATLQENFRSWAQTDLAIFQRLGVNTVVVKNDFGAGAQAKEVLDQCYQHGIKVIMVTDYPLNGEPPSTDAVAAVVNAGKDHPALLMWAVGCGISWTENGYNTLQEAAEATERNTQLIKSIDSKHPVTALWGTHPESLETPLSEARYPYRTGRPYFETIVNTIAPSVDAWSLEPQSRSLEGLLPAWKTISDKPLLLGIHSSWPEEHSNAELWDEIYFQLSAERQHGVCLGGFRQYFTNPNWETGVQDPNVVLPAELVILGERYLGGANAVQLNHALFYNIELHGSGDTAWTVIKLNEKYVYSAGGGGDGGRGLNVVIPNRDTGVGITQAVNFDTWGQPAAAWPAFTKLLRELPTGTPIIIASCDDAGFGQDAANAPLTREAVAELEALGSKRVRDIGFRDRWAMTVVKGKSLANERLHRDDGDPTSVIFENVFILNDLNPDADRWPSPQLAQPTSNSNVEVVINDAPGAGNYQIVGSSSASGPWTVIDPLVPGDPSGRTTWQVPAELSGEAKFFFRALRIGL